RQSGDRQLPLWLRAGDADRTRSRHASAVELERAAGRAAESRRRFATIGSQDGDRVFAAIDAIGRLRPGDAVAVRARGVSRRRAAFSLVGDGAPGGVVAGRRSAGSPAGEPLAPPAGIDLADASLA